MQAFLPASLLANTPAQPVANPSTPSARAVVPSANNAFSRQLEQSRQRVRESARPPPQPAANKSAAPPPAPAARQPAKPPEPARSESQRAAERGPRKADAPAKPEAASTEAGAEVSSADRDDQPDRAEATTAAPSDLLGLPHPPTDPTALPAAAPAEPSAAGVPVPDGAAPGQPRSVALPGNALSHTTEGATAVRAAPAAGTGTNTTAPAVQPGHAAAREPREAAGTVDTMPASWQQAQAAAASTGGIDPAREGKAERLAEAHAIIEGADRGLSPIGLAGPGSTAQHTAKAGEVAQATLAAPVTSPEFRAALGAQVSILARAGVQQAELHLNPAELGPVSIQIVLDGQQAQVNFGADSALTRQIIEAGMPELAGALRDAGLTLTGGGVSQHAGGQRRDGNGNESASASGSSVHSGTHGDGATDALAEQTRRSAARVAQGGVDLYA